MAKKQISRFPLNEKFSGFSGFSGLSGLSGHVPNYANNMLGGNQSQHVLKQAKCVCYVLSFAMENNGFVFCVSDCQDLVTCGLCGRKFPLKQLSAFIKHKALSACAQHRPLSPQEGTEGSGSDFGGVSEGHQRTAYKSLRSPSVSASNQTADMDSSAALADSSGTELDEEDGEGREGVRRKSASSTSCLLDAATNTSCDSGQYAAKPRKVQLRTYTVRKVWWILLYRT